MAYTIKRYGWVKDRLDRRDHQYTVKFGLNASSRPSNFSLKPQCPAVYNQLQLGSCTANAVGAAVEFDLLKQKLPAFTPSRLFIYYNERDLEGTTASDSGAQIRDGIKTVATLGACPETDWAYVPEEFAVRPSQNCYDDAIKFKAVDYHSIAQDADALIDCLLGGYPFVFGFSVHASFESAKVAQTGIVEMPGWFDHPVGDHAVLGVAYDDTTRRFLVRNSWGADWGQEGYFTIPYDYVTDPDLASDFWTIRVMS
jgi:C1A family cysteine protease